jgi:glycerol-3-phosphate dehydrogenase
MRGSRILGIHVQDVLTGSAFEVRGRFVVNTSGPWINQVLEMDGGPRPRRPIGYVKSINALTPPLTEGDYGVAVRVPHFGMHNGVHDGCCVRYFSVPWKGTAVVGSYDVLANTMPGPCCVHAAEMDKLIERVNAAFPGAHFTLSDVMRVHVGLIPHSDTEPRADPYNAARHFQIIDHKRRDGYDGLLSIVPIKFTTARSVAAKATTLLLAKLGRAPAPSRSATVPLHGGKIDQCSTYESDMHRQRPCGLNEKLLGRLIATYGSECREVLKIVEQLTGAGMHDQCDLESTVVKAQVISAVRNEMALTLTDVIMRRTSVGVLRHPGPATLRTCADVMARELGWSAATLERELSETETHFARAWARADAPHAMRNCPAPTIQ